MQKATLKGPPIASDGHLPCSCLIVTAATSSQCSPVRGIFLTGSIGLAQESSTSDARSATGATAAYRGYRRQALYVLSRILRPGQPHLIFHPEGIEDLAVYDGKRLVEVCQVKALEEPLSFTDLEPAHGDSFFRRAANRACDEAAPLQVISFGPVGPEL